mgnify:CR=1 FL=1
MMDMLQTAVELLRELIAEGLPVQDALDDVGTIFMLTEQQAASLKAMHNTVEVP